MDYLKNPDYIDELFKNYKENPDSVDISWRKFFEGFEFALKNYKTNQSDLFVDKEFKVIDLINAYRQRGHFFTDTNPVRARRKYSPSLDIENFGLAKEDLKQNFKAGNEIGIGEASLESIINHLRLTYCKSIGVEFIYIREPEKVSWLKKKMEGSKNSRIFSNNEKKHIFSHLVHAVEFESFIHKKFVGQKRFSLEGAESLIPALDAVIEKGAEFGIKEFVIGMPHRGRLNILANILMKPEVNIFQEFNGKEYDEEEFLGDVKYHLGFVNKKNTDTGEIVKLTLTPNPSHLETVSAVAQGISRAKLLHKYDDDFSKLAPIVIHGDAAVAAQGIVYEVLQMSQLPGYKTGGTIHLVINNQVGFTTNYTEARSSTYCTDIAKVTRCPVFHVNGDDVEALIYSVDLAIEYRQKFNTDVFIDILCYRKYGHNEGDEPRFTQPLLYKAIEKHPNVKEIYKSKILSENVFSAEEVDKIEKDYIEHLDKALEDSRKIDTVHVTHFMHEEWSGYDDYIKSDVFCKINTSIGKDKLFSLAKKITTLPEGQNFFRKIIKLMEDRWSMVENDNLDWAMCEMLAYASLVTQNVPVRISGQDSERGTFSHRHATLVIEDTDQKYTYLKFVDENQAKFHVINSLLSEYGVLGFEYGYSLALPNGLNIWEAQFGDFTNVAQVIIDQYISSAHDKWGLSSGLVLFLPHGYEGQGPEHSSARMERFLNLYANCNMQIVNITRPSNIFHVLRRQIIRNYRIPLIVFTPKSLLRNPDCTSKVDELTNGNFLEVIDDQSVEINNVNQILLCSGKIYYELNSFRNQLKDNKTAIIRIEQIAPLNKKLLLNIISKYSFVERIIWVQEEPENMGAWSFIKKTLKEIDLWVIARPESGSTAEGLSEQHKLRQGKILNKCFKKCNCDKAMVYCGMNCENK